MISPLCSMDKTRESINLVVYRLNFSL